jgi:integrase
LRVPDAERFLADAIRRSVPKTRDHHAAALRGFGRWLERTGRWDRDPFEGPARCSTAQRDRHRVFKRVSFRFEEAERLVEAAWARHEAEKALGGMPTQYDYDHGEAVRDRQVLYWFALTTAFRANECASLRWEDLTLDGAKPSRSAGRHVHEERRPTRTCPLQNFVAEALREDARSDAVHSK